MTLEEAIQKANEGDVETMVRLADHYAENSQFDEAQIWFQKAADCGNPYATFQSISFLLCDIATDMCHAVCRQDSTALWERALDTCEHTLHYCGQLVDTSKPENIAFFKRTFGDGTTVLDSFQEKYNELSFRKAQCLLEIGCLDRVIRYTDDETAPKFTMLRALALYNQAVTSTSDALEALPLLEKASELWQSVFNSNYAPSDDQTEQLEFARSVFLYAGRIRTDANSRENIEASYQLLATQIQKVTEPNGRKFLEKALSHYQVEKGFFGTSITYVD